MENETITIGPVVETQFGEKAVIDAPYEAKDFVKHLPWEDGAVDRDRMKDDGVPDSRIVEFEGFDFGETSAHASFDFEDKNWLIDVDAVDTATEFWEGLGFTVENDL